MTNTLSSALEDWVISAREITLKLIEDLDEQQLIGPRLEITNPLLWEIGHVAWFHERWVLRHVMGRPPLLDGSDKLYDSASIGHRERWDCRLLTRADTLHYALKVRDAVLQALERRSDPQLDYFVRLAVFHEDMHAEAFAYTRQTLNYPAPTLLRERESFTVPVADTLARSCQSGDIPIAGGKFYLGSTPSEPFVFDNEKWAHLVHVAPFRISRTAVSQSEFTEFVDDGGYTHRDLWSDAGWQWRVAAGAQHPNYWRRDHDGTWYRRTFNKWVALEPHLPVVHVNYFEAEAYCRWANRRLPTEAEWELACAGTTCAGECHATGRKRRYAWGDDEPALHKANLSWQYGGTIPVFALPAGDSPFGCRQMIGNVWEWTASDFLPYPGFVPDPYEQYSRPWFGTHKVLRGGCWATQGRLIRNTWRNFYTPDRRDVWAGFRTCALGPG